MDVRWTLNVVCLLGSHITACLTLVVTVTRLNLFIQLINKLFSESFFFFFIYTDSTSRTIVIGVLIPIASLVLILTMYLFYKRYVQTKDLKSGPLNGEYVLLNEQ